MHGIGNSSANDELEQIISNSPAHESTDNELVLPPLVRVIEEAAGNEPWALIGAASCRLQGVDSHSPNLEFMTTAPVVNSLADMLDVDTIWQRGKHLAAERLHFLRDDVPVFVFSKPIFHGNYDTLAPMEIPALWDALVTVELSGFSVPATPLEWEFLLAVILGGQTRLTTLVNHLKATSYDGRLLTRLLREGRVQAETEDSVWFALEDDEQ